MSDKEITGRIKTLELSNFRGYVANGTRLPFDLDADIILISGKNGVGKTSLLMALDRLLNGLTGYMKLNAPLLTVNQDSGELKLGLGEGVTRNLPHSKWETVDQPEEGGELRRSETDANLHSYASFFYQDDTRRDIKDAVGWLTPKDERVDAVFRAIDRKSSAKLLKEARERFVIPLFDPGVIRRPAIAAMARTLAELAERKDFPGLDALRQINLVINQDNPAKHWESQVEHLLHIVDELAGRPLSSAATTLDRLKAIADGFAALGRLEIGENLDDQDIQRRNVIRELAKMDDSAMLMLVDGAFDFLDTGQHDFVPLVATAEECDKLAKLIEALEQSAAEKRSEVARRTLAIEELAGDKNEHAMLNVFERAVEVLPLWHESLDKEKNLLEIRQWLEANSAPMRHAVESLRDWRVKALQINEIARQEVSRFNLLQTRNRQSLKLSESFLRLGGDILAPRPRNQRIPLLELRDALYRLSDDLSASRSQTARVCTEASERAKEWARVEEEIEKEIRRRPHLGEEKAGLKLFDAAERILKREQSEGGLTRLLPDEMREHLVGTLNRLLVRFHFPPDFLPIRVRDMRGPRVREPAWELVAGKEGESLHTASLSTGQRAQIAICWCISLNYALEGVLNHRVMAFDDFTTALDMGQLIPAATLLRQIAYCGDKKERRQVIVTSHHEDLTNKLLDYLLPPPDCSLKIIEFTEWTRADGAIYRSYQAQVPQDTFNAGALRDWLEAQRRKAGNFGRSEP